MGERGGHTMVGKGGVTPWWGKGGFHPLQCGQLPRMQGGRGGGVAQADVARWV
jgi:hypothetical protein